MDQTSASKMLFLRISVVLLLNHVSVGVCHKILLLPYGYKFNSHVLDMMRISEILVTAGHDTHFLVGDTSLDTVARAGRPMHVFKNGVKLPGDLTEVVKEIYMKQDAMNSLMLMKIMKTVSDENCESLLTNHELIEKLRQEKFDLIIVDFCEYCYSLLVSKLNIPSAGYSPVGFAQGLGSTTFPYIPSFMPTIVSPYNSSMSFLQRLHNLIESLLMEQLMDKYVFNELYTLAELNQAVMDPKIFLKQPYFLRSNPLMDEPFPRMPHLVEIGGALMKPASPLPSYLEKWVKGAGDNGLIIVSFGTLVKDITDERANIMSRVLSSLPSRVIWKQRHRPAGLGDNILLMDWLPQNDLLGQNKTRLFITHGGMSSAYEAVYHGVPVVTIPLLGDQFRNSNKLVGRLRMGRKVKFHGMAEEEFREAVREVLSNPEYAKNARTASKSLLDLPLHPRDNFLFYVDHIVRTNGARHLIEDNITNLNWIQMNSIDTLACLAAIVCLAFIITCTFIYIFLKMMYKCGSGYLGSGKKKIQ